MAAADIIGRCTCPVCASDRASLRLSSRQLSYLLCNACNCQLFARSDNSDNRLRALLIAESPVPPTTIKPTAIAAAVAVTSAPAAPARAAWGFGLGVSK